MRKKTAKRRLIVVHDGDQDGIQVLPHHHARWIRERSVGWSAPTTKRRRAYSQVIVVAYGLLSIFCMLLHTRETQALVPSRTSTFALGQDNAVARSLSTSLLFPSRTRTTISTTTRRHMVLTTPEAIIEQASTQKLLDDLIDESVRTSARRPIMMQFDPSGGWIWKRWQGTIFSETWDSCVARMVYACAVFLVCRAYPRIKEPLSGFNVLWGQLLSVTTFTLTFFVNQSYALWRKCYELSRRLQGRLHDLNLSLVAHAARKPAAGPNEPTTYTPAARQVLDLVSRYVRLFNLLTYASFTRSHRPILTPRGMRRLVERGLMTPQEREVLVDAEVPATQRHNAVLLWIIRVFVEAREAGHFLGGAGFEDQWLEKAHVCRAQYGAIGDELQGRMPLAYAHIVQVLVDFVLWMYPFMAVSSGMSGFVCVLGTGLLTIGYQGLFDLAKQFLDPYDNESYGKGEDPLVVDTLIAETNAGSIRWVNGLNEMPVSYQKIKDGELSDHLLPIRGYSVEELEQMEKEKRELERELQERREREEAERLRQEEQKELELQAAKAMIPARLNTRMTTSPRSLAANGNTTSFILSTAENSQIFPNVLATTNLSTSQDLTKFIDDALALNGAVPQSIVPDKTALAELSPKVRKKKEVRTSKTKTPINGEPFRTEVEAAVSVAADNDEMGPNGQERQLSHVLADEIWEDEKGARPEKQTPMSSEAYILKTDPGAESEDFSAREIVQEGPSVDSVSQLRGFQPDKHSEIPADKGPPVTTLSSDVISLLSGGGDHSSLSQKEPPTTDPEETQASHSGGESIVGGVPGTRKASPKPDDESEASRRRGDPTPESKEYRMNQMVADEVRQEEKEPLQELSKFEDYEKQVEEILRREREELLETQAILNAPPGANYLDVPGQEEYASSLSNTTESRDELAILEMDIPTGGTDASSADADFVAGQTEATDPSEILESSAEKEGDLNMRNDDVDDGENEDRNL